MAAIAAFFACLVSLLTALQPATPAATAQGGQQPAAKGAAQGGSLVVLCKNSNTGHVLDPATGKSVATFATGVGPHEVAVSPDGATAVISNYGQMKPGSSLTVLSLPSAEVTKTIDLGDFRRPHGVVFLDAATVLVTAEMNQSLLKVNITTGKVDRFTDTKQQGSHMTCFAAGRAFTANVGSGTATVIDLATGEVKAQVESGHGAEGMDVSPDGTRLWVANNQEASICVIDPAEAKVLKTLTTGEVPIRVKFTPDGSRVLVTAAKSGELRVYNAATHEEVRKIDVRPAAPLPEHPQFGDSPIPMGIVVTPDNAHAYLTLIRTGEVVQVDLGTYTVANRWKVCEGPDGIAWTAVAPKAP